jgi:hypothetical protein
MVRYKDVLLDRIGRLVDEALDIEAAEGADWYQCYKLFSFVADDKA